MKKSQIFFLILCLGHNIYANELGKPSPIELRSKEEILFYSKKEASFASIGKIPEYQGIIVRPNEPSEELNSMDLYKFPNKKKIKMSEELCRDYVDKIFGNVNKRSLKLNHKPHLLDTSIGKSCIYQLTDSYQAAKQPHRFAISGFIHGRLITLVWKLSKDPTLDSISSMENFWKNLR